MKAKHRLLRDALDWRFARTGTLLRWRYLLGFAPQYWRALKAREALRFQLGRQGFGLRRRLRSQGDALVITFSILRVIAGQLLLAVLLVVAIELLERWLRGGLSSLGYVRAAAGLVSQLRAMAAAISPDAMWHQGLLSSLAEIAGVFLGLYYAAMGTVIATAYARVPDDIRDLAIREQLGNAYVRSVILLAGTSLLLLAANALGLRTGLLNLLFVALLGLFPLYGFVRFGIGAFDLLDPASLLDLICPELSHSFRSATHRGFRWQDVSFQWHYHQRALGLLSSYASIVSLATSLEMVHDRAPARTVRNALAILLAYADAKLHIPSDSYWFRRAQRHPSWFTADYTNVQLALRSGGTLLPESEPNHLWFEEEIESITTRALAAIFAASGQQTAVALADDIHRTLSSLADSFCTVEALHLFRALGPLMRREMRGAHPSAASSRGHDAGLYALALAEIYACGLIHVLLGFTQSLRHTDDNWFPRLIANIDWRRSATLYHNKLPRPVVVQLEHLHEGLSFEQEVEGKLVTPLWYREQIAALGFARYISECVGGIIGELESAIADEAQSLSQQGHNLVAVQLVQRGLELCDKLKYHLPIISEFCDHLPGSGKPQGPGWPAVDWEQHLLRVDASRDRLLVVLAKCLPTLQAAPPQVDLPDYFGYAYSILADECFSAMAHGKEELFRRTYTPLFDACLSAHDRLRDQSATRDPVARLALAADPIMDLLALSGYARIYTELHDKPYWDTAKGHWDAYLSNVSDAASLINYLLSIAKHHPLYGGPRTIVRTSWKRRLQRQLRDRGLLGDHEPPPFGVDEDIEPRHPSDLIRVLTATRFLTHDPETVFLALYMAERPEVAGLEIPHRVTSFMSFCGRQRSRRESGSGAAQ